MHQFTQNSKDNEISTRMDLPALHRRLVNYGSERLEIAQAKIIIQFKGVEKKQLNSKSNELQKFLILHHLIELIEMPALQCMYRGLLDYFKRRYIHAII